MKGTNVIVPVIGDDANKLFNKYIKNFQNAGYNVEIAYKHADSKTSANRVVSRAIETGRFIPRNTVLNSNYGGKHVKKSRYSEL